MSDPKAATPASWAAFRALVPVTNRWAYFDNAAVAPLPETSRAAILRWANEATEEGDTAWPQWLQRGVKVRRLAAQILNAADDEIAIINNTTHGITLVAEGFPWQEGDNIVTLENEFPSNLYPWMNLASYGVEVRRLPVEEGRVDLERIAAACDARTRLITVSWVGYALGWRLDVAKLVQMAHDRDVLVFLDAIQGLGVFPLDVQATGVDFLAADGHKWMLGPEGAGIFFVRKEHLDTLRPIGVGWNSVVQGADFGHIDLNLRPEAARYEGGSQNLVGMIGLAASLQTLIDFGLTPQSSPIAERVLEVTDYACQRLAAIGADVASCRESDHRSGIVAFSPPAGDPVEVRRRCLDNGVVLSFRGGWLRISPHAYCNEDDVDRMIAVLQVTS
ncbi:MAG: aminotransferase class V-fold PLP-dependent enzyme [Pirellulaceae bacterium]|jgi:selenocysteine lyase/cysteine desulfurase|nr:cysteine desulfurase [Planctomycetaceae bacterium]MDP6555829.1 aminotransferase class V-fold PLP-dependent enzyme [Pirellulaceae bacterium]